MLTLDVPERVNAASNAVIYSITNECLDAIIAGLDVKPQDRILAVGGSGDQAFALLEHVKRVTFVDVEPTQIELIKLRTQALREGQIAPFFYVGIESHREGDKDIVRARNQYFNTERLGRISEKLEALEIIGPEGILEVAERLPKNTFNKMYLSNVRPRNPDGDVTYDEQEKLLDRLSRRLHRRGIIYCSNFIRFPPLELVSVDEELTQKARQLEKESAKTAYYNWMPTVLKKK